VGEVADEPPELSRGVMSMRRGWEWRTEIAARRGDDGDGYTYLDE